MITRLNCLVFKQAELASIIKIELKMSKDKFSTPKKNTRKDYSDENFNYDTLSMNDPRYWFSA